MSGSKVRLTPVRSRGERQRGRKERERAKEEKEFMLGTARKCGRIFLNILCAETQKELFAPSTNSPIFCKQRPYPLPRVSIYTCNALCIYCSQGYSCYCYLLLSCCQADGKPCTMLPTSCALFQLLKGTGPDGACVPVFCACVCVCLQVYTLAPGSPRTGTSPSGSSMQRFSLSRLLTESASV